MDFKNINTILYKFSSQFKMGNPNIVNSVVLNLDYLLVNFPYFKDIEVVLDFLLSNNKELRFVLRDQVPMILRILKYKKDYEEYEEESNKVIGFEESRSNLTPYKEGSSPYKDRPSSNLPLPSNLPLSSLNPLNSPSKPPYKSSPHKSRIPYFFNNSNFISKNKVFLWKKFLKGLTLKKFYNSWLNEENDIIFNLNEEKVVYDGVFKILSFHFDLLRDWILIELNFEYLDKLLKFIELESAQDLLSKLLDKRLNNNLYLILKLLKEMKVCKRLLEIECYYELEIYILNENRDNENNDILNEIYDLRNNLLDKFLKEKSFIKWRSICRILEMMYKIKRDGEIKIVGMCEGIEEGGSKVDDKDKEREERGSKVDKVKEGNEGGKVEGVEDKEREEHKVDDKMKSIALEDTGELNLKTIPPLKFKFYIRLLCIPLDFSLPLIFKSNFYLKFIGFFLDNPDDSFYSNSLFDFFKISLGNSEYKNLLEKAGFIKGIEKIMLRNLSELYGGRPKTEASFIYCIYLLNEIKDNSYYDLVNLIMTGDSLKYNDDLKIDEYLDNFLNDIIIRFTCNLVIDRMPVLSAFLNKEEHPDTKVEFAESKEEKRVRLGGGMQDTL